GAGADAFWTGVRVDPVEIALPSGVGYTLRAYRMDTEITPTDVSDRAEEPEAPGRTDAYDTDFDDEDLEDDDDEDDEDEDLEDEEDDDEGEQDDEDEDTDEQDAEAAAAPGSEEIPVFLSHRGRLLVFRSAEGLVDFVRSGADHDLAQIDSWTEVSEGIDAAHVVAVPDD